MANTWIDKRFYIAQLADFLVTREKKMSLQELGEHLNRNGFTSDSSGEPYSETHGRGVGELVSSTHRYFKDEEKDEVLAEKIACAFVKEDNTYAWK